MKKFNLKKCGKSNKGITLIALIITIIVLLILAGITINALTGSDSAPAKANEAEQKNDIGTAKDQIGITAVNAKTEAYETAYVGNSVTSTAASTTVGQAVIDEVKAYNGKTQGKASIEVTQAETNSIKGDATITITTRDFEVEGTITIQDGLLTWGEIEENVPGIKITGVPTSLDKGKYVDLGIKRRDVTGDVTWTSGTTSVATVDSNTGRVTGVAAGTSIITANVAGTTYTAQCTITVVLPEQVIGQYVDLGTNILGNGTTKDWRILSKKSSGTWVILADYMPNNYKPSGEANSTIGTIGLQTSGTYNVYSSTNRNTLLAGLNYDGNQTSAATWKKLIPSETLRNKADVRGAVTGDILMASYNEKYETNLDYTSGSSARFYKDRSDSSKGYDDLYVPHNEVYNNECYGYWLASPHASNTNNVWFVYCVGFPDNGYYYGTSRGVRPAVYLGSNVTLTKTGTGENTVWTAQ